MAHCSGIRDFRRNVAVFGRHEVDADGSNQNRLSFDDQGNEMKSNPISEDLIAPCGMNCAICSRYLAYASNLKRSQCAGCRTGKKVCTYLFAKCTGANHCAEGEAVFCFECEQFPCAQINRMDRRYRKNYQMSVKDNLEHIREKGIKSFLEDQYETYQCSRCGGVFSIHNRKCFNCDSITRLVEKLPPAVG